MPAALSVNLDLRNLAKFRTLLAANKRIAAQSLTFTAEKARDAWRVEEEHEFHLRRRWLITGTQVRFATPNNLNAQVGSLDKFFGRHVVGIDEEKDSESGKLFVPIQPIEEQGTHTQIRAALRRMASTKTQPFWQHGVLLRRTGRDHDAPLKVLAVLRQSVHIKPRFKAEEITSAIVAREFPLIYERLLLKWAETA